MWEKVCRLCFVEKAKPIGILNADGIEMNIAEAIRVHFSDEVSREAAK